MKPLTSIRIAATFVAEPLEPSLRFWLSCLGWNAKVTFAPYNQIFQELLSSRGASSAGSAVLVLVRPEDWLTRQQPRPATEPVGSAIGPVPARYRLPNGVEVAELNRAETDHLYREIFEHRAYLRHGIQIEDAATVVDCGANIGMFSLFAHLHARAVRILAIEPSPRAVETLRANAALHGMALEAVEAGLSDRDGSATFTFYENYSLVSGFDAAADEDETFLRRAIRSTLRAESEETPEGTVVDTLADHLVAERMRRTETMRPTRRLGGLLRERSIERIDLLKIDVEKAERRVLDGLDADQWPAIQQIVMEIHDTGDAIPSTVTELERRGFRVTLEEERDLKDTGVWNLFAIRPEYQQEAAARADRRHREILRNVDDLATATREAVSKRTGPVVLLVCPPSAPMAVAPGAGARQQEIVESLRSGTAGLSNVVVWDAQRTADLYRCPDYYDWRADALGHMPYSQTGYDALTASGVRALHAWAKPPTKVVAVDCDNTLWAGVAAEDGPGGVRIGANHRLLHARLAELAESGVLIALVSKNEPADVWAVFDSRADLGLSRSHVVAARMNWSAKSENLRALAAELNLGLESFVFLDDNPVECAEVGARAPDVTVLQWPMDPAAAKPFLDHLWPLDVGPTTDEDRKRTAMYQQEAARRELRDSASSLEAFLASLELELTIAPIASAEIPRAAQLTERTNQFNFTTVRRGEDQVRALVAGGSDVLTLRVKDRFGDYGLVGLAIANRVPERASLVVDTFLMSCRVLGKGVEHRLLAALGDLAVAAGLDTVELPFEPTARNTPAWLFATSLSPRSPASTPVRTTFVWPSGEVRDVTFQPGAGSEPPAETADDSATRTDAETTRPDYQRIAGELHSAAAISRAVHTGARTAGRDLKSYAAPTTDAERVLARIWAEQLHHDRVGIHDNFFALGGDSIVAIQVLSRAAQAGLAMTMKDLFEHDTVFELARVVERRRPAVAQETDAAPGTDVPLTPIQKWFFDKALPDVSHWNMEMVVRASGEVDQDRLERSLAALVGHHAALRFRYHRSAEGWSQVAGPAPATRLVDVVSVPVDADERRHAMALVASRLHAGLDLERGPLIRAAICTIDGGAATEVIVVAHHLVCDGITWRVLLEDLDRAYGQLSAGEAVTLPLRSTPFNVWAERLARYAASESLAAERPYWEKAASERSATIHPDHRANRADATEATLIVAPSVFSVEDTRRLLTETAAAFDSQVNDVLLAALAVAFEETFGAETLKVDLEGHGREPLFEDVDLSRTVGWFTTIFPVRVEGCAGDLRRAVAVARSVRLAVPRRGIGYGVLRYLHPDTSIREAVAGAGDPEVMFNYLGQFDQTLGAESRFALSPDVDFGPLHGARGLRSHLFEIIGRIVGGRLRLDWMYSGALFEPSSVARLIESYERALRRLLDIARETAPDASARWTAVQARLGPRTIEDVYPLAPIQQLFLVALETGQLTGLDQWRLTLEGPLDLDAFERAWTHVVDRHTSMRTAFVSDLPGGPVQAVLDRGRLTWFASDLSGLEAAPQAAAIRSYVEADARQPFDPLQPPLMRVAVFRRSERRAELIWTFHHLLIDGWSCPVVFAAVGEAYDAFAAGRPAPPTGSAYAPYVAWLGQRREADSESFWRRYLAGVTAPTSLPRPADAPNVVLECEAVLAAAETSAVLDRAREWRVSLNTLLQLAWALVLARQSHQSDVVFGVAFSGRPEDLPNVEGIIGPFVNNVPVRVRLSADQTIEDAARSLQADQFELAAHQTTPLPSVQEWSEVPPSVRIFDSLLVLQSYRTAAGLRHLGTGLAVTNLHAPVRTNYPFTVIAVPAASLAIRLIANPGAATAAQVERLAHDLALAVRLFAGGTPSVGTVMAALSAPDALGHTPAPRLRSTHPTPPRPGLESTLAAIWRRSFGVEDIGVNETFTALGGQSLLMLRIHRDIERALGRTVSIVALFEHPTIRSLAEHLEGPAPAGDRAAAARDRAARQQAALARHATRGRS